MKLSKLWLSDWVKVSLTAQELANQLTMAGLEVDAVSPVAGPFNQVIVAQVLSAKPHPNADKLSLCAVDAGKDKPLQIVCGASNVRPGLKVALAMVGATLPGGFQIKESELRGIVSQGMLCSLSELGLAEVSEGIMELDEDAPLGQDLRTYLELDDFVLDLDITPNRADCFSLLGLARELSALNHLPLVEPSFEPPLPTTDKVIPLKISAVNACPRYCARVICGINSKTKTPLWMRERLRRGGIRSIHPIVDVMNYVMLELGQPMHAFDLAGIQGGIEVRFASDTETLQLLDEQTVTLNPKVLVIADAQKPLALAGIMGGLDSAVGVETSDLLLESAFFDPVSLAGVARQFGLFSESSLRFERGVDPSIQKKALERASELILSIAGGRAGPIIEVLDETALPPKISLTFDPAVVKRITGLDIAEAKMKQFLEGLGMLVHPRKDALFEVSVPSHRFDIRLEVDLVEEIIRLYGYDKLEPETPRVIAQAGRLNPMLELQMGLAHWFRDRAYHESISYSFVDPELQASLYPERETLTLLNPISSELSQMRLGLWPGLIASMIYNAHRQQNTFKLFEMGVVFEVRQQQLKEHPSIAGLLMGGIGELNWSEETRSFDFYDLKGDLQSLFVSLHLKPEFIAAPHPALHPGQSAKIIINNQEVGWMGSLHPRLSDALELTQNVYLFELRLEHLTQAKRLQYKPISKYPLIRRDLSLLIAESVTCADIEAAVKACFVDNWLKAFEVFDVYKGLGVPEGKKSLGISLILQDEQRTLVDAEINSLIHAIISSLERNFSATLRD